MAGGFAAVEPSVLARGLLCSCAIYCAGLVFNDVADVAEDRRLGRDRPIVTGTFGRGSAAITGSLLGVLGLAVAPWHRLGAIPILLVGLVLAYDFAAKRKVLLGALALGACRMLNLCLGWFLVEHAPAAEPSWLLLGPACAYGAFVMCAVAHGALEDRTPSVRSSTVVLALAAGSGYIAAAFLPNPLLAAAAALPTTVLVLRAPSADPGWIGRRTGILLRGLSRFTLALPLGAAAWLEATVIAGLAYGLPLVLRVRRWS